MCILSSQLFIVQYLFHFPDLPTILPTSIMIYSHIHIGDEITDIFMLEDDTDVYLSTGPDFIEPMIRNIHVTKPNDKTIMTLPLSRNDRRQQHGQVGGGGFSTESIGVVLEPIPGALFTPTHFLILHPLFVSFNFCS